jgi:hypothetical protein
VNASFFRPSQPFSAYQTKALEIARLADTAADPYTRADLLRLAAGYERLALRRCRAVRDKD